MRGFALPAAGYVITHVDRDPAEPRSDAGLTVETLDAAVQLEKRLLHGIFGILTAAQDVIRHTLQPRTVRKIHLFKCGDFAPAAGRQQFTLAFKFSGLRPKS